MVQHLTILNEINNIYKFKENFKNTVRGAFRFCWHYSTKEKTKY